MNRRFSEHGTAALDGRAGQSGRVLHPFFLAIYPIAFLWQVNVGQVALSQLARPLVVSLAIVTVWYFSLKRICRSREQAGLLASLVVMAFFSYGHVYILLHESSGMAFGLGHHRYVLGFGSIAFTVCAVAIWFKARSAPRLTYGLNWVSGGLVALAFLMGIGSLLSSASRATGHAEPEVATAGRDRLPNVYYVVLDAYPRHDVLVQNYHYDDSEFLDSLRSMGFYIAEERVANYPYTIASLASSLNFTYLDEVAPEMGDSTDMAPLVDLIKNNATVRILRRLGYRFVCFQTAYDSTTMRQADVYMGLNWSMGEFESILIKTTALLPLIDKLWRNQDGKRRLFDFTIDRLPATTRIEGPIFAFVHIAAPHWPMLFDADGRAVRPLRLESPEVGVVRTEEGREVYEQRFVGFVAHTGRRISAAIEDLLAGSRETPIIIVQGDHGSYVYDDESFTEDRLYHERLSILNAYLVPNEVRDRLYPGISPVNTFRLILNELAGTEFELLEDRSHYARRTIPYRFEDVTARVAKAEPPLTARTSEPRARTHEVTAD